MAPTTIGNQVTSTSPRGKDVHEAGEPIKMAEMIAGLPGCYYSERTALNNVQNIRATKRAIQRAIEYQRQGKGLSFVEILSPCPTGLKMAPVNALKWIGTEAVAVYPLGVIKEPEGDHEK